MIIAISGPQGCGKTTTLGLLPQEQVIARKTARAILEDWKVTLQDVNEDADLTMKFQDELFKVKWTDEATFGFDGPRRDELMFTERTFADLFTYAAISIGKHNRCQQWLTDYYMKCINANLALYTGVYLLPRLPSQPVEHDGVRATSPYYSMLVEGAISQFTRSMRVPGSRSPRVTDVPHSATTPKERLDFILLDAIIKR